MAKARNMAHHDPWPTCDVGRMPLLEVWPRCRPCPYCVSGGTCRLYTENNGRTTNITQIDKCRLKEGKAGASS